MPTVLEPTTAGGCGAANATAHVDQRRWSPASVAKHALAEAEPASSPARAIRSCAPAGQRIVACDACPDSASGSSATESPPFVEGQVRGEPDASRAGRRRLELDAGEPLEGNPVVLAVDEASSIGPRRESASAIHSNGVAVDAAGVAGAASNALARSAAASVACAPCPGAAATRSAAPASRRARRTPSASLAGEDLGAQRLAADARRRTSGIGPVDGSSSAATLSWLSARSHWPSTQSSCDRKTRRASWFGAARTAAVRCASAPFGSPPRTAASASDLGSDFPASDMAAK